jgi:hypothetical protein
MRLTCVPQLPPKGFHDQTEQRIGSSIRNKNEVKSKGVKTKKCDRASDADENVYDRFYRPNPAHFGEVHRPAAGNQKARARPSSNSVSHTLGPLTLRSNSSLANAANPEHILGGLLWSLKGNDLPS